MATVQQLQQKLTYANKRVSYAWAKYYDTNRTTHHEAIVHYTVLTTQSNDTAIPSHIKATLTEMATELKKKWECPVCLDMIKDGELEISNCGHFYCKPCLDTIKDKARTEHLEKWECAVCRRKHKVSGED